LKTSEYTTIGWREWVGLPELGISKIKVKVDTGARTSALHATHVEVITKSKSKWVKFNVHPSQDGHGRIIKCEAPLLEFRKIKSSTGHLTIRPVISSIVKLGEFLFEAEFTLVDREMMGFRMLLGREAIRNRFLVHAGRSFKVGKQKKKKLKRIK
jgi:hypothetical protein